MSEALKPEDVFTPRAANVNKHTYVSRPDLEQALQRALRMPKHVVIHGESGTGKSWLYKKVLGSLDYHIEVANMGLCSSHGSIKSVLENNICGSISHGKVKKSKIGITPIIQAGIEHEESISHPIDIFLEALKCVSERAGEKKCALVFDNLERVVADSALASELAGLLLLVDDQKYAQYNVKIVLVGTSNEIRTFIKSTTISNTIANRLTEIPEVSRLDFLQARELVKTGLFDKLGCELIENETFGVEVLYRWIAYHSDRIPQFLQELSLHVAYEAQDNAWSLNQTHCLKGAREWIKSSLVQDVTRVEDNLNSKKTKIGRRNQVIYCLGLCTKYDFSRLDIEDLLHKNFPASANGVTLNISQILSELVQSTHPLISRSPKINCFRFVDPKFRIVVRWLLVRRDETEDIQLRSFDDAIGLWSSLKYSGDVTN